MCYDTRGSILYNYPLSVSFDFDARDFGDIIAQGLAKVIGSRYLHSSRGRYITSSHSI
jgi:hypothetical protein